jgi:hypothetical protein
LGWQFEGVPAYWLAYIEVDDIDKRVAAAKQAGAQVIREPYDLKGVGRIAILKDAVGALVAWVKSIPIRLPPGDRDRDAGLLSTPAKRRCLIRKNYRWRTIPSDRADDYNISEGSWCR